MGEAIVIGARPPPPDHQAGAAAQHHLHHHFLPSSFIINHIVHDQMQMSTAFRGKLLDT
jgi:hypothetical protein